MRWETLLKCVVAALLGSTNEAAEPKLTLPKSLSVADSDPKEILTHLIVRGRLEVESDEERQELAQILLTLNEAARLAAKGPVRLKADIPVLILARKAFPDVANVINPNGLVDLAQIAAVVTRYSNERWAGKSEVSGKEFPTGLVDRLTAIYLVQDPHTSKRVDSKLVQGYSSNDSKTEQRVDVAPIVEATDFSAQVEELADTVYLRVTLTSEALRSLQQKTGTVSIGLVRKNRMLGPVVLREALPSASVRLGPFTRTAFRAWLAPQ